MIHSVTSTGLGSHDLNAPDQELVISANAEWFKLGDQPPTMLETRLPLRRLLLALAQMKLSSPNAALSVTAAFEAGWPGERANPVAAATRVYTAIHALRHFFGLGELLARRRRGYFLQAKVRLLANESQIPPSMPEVSDPLAEAV